MKLFSITFLLSWLSLQGFGADLCKVELLRSLGFHSNIVPTRTNILCPKISLNCCTKHDQLKMYKRWRGGTSPLLKKQYRQQLKEYGKLNSYVKMLEDIDLNMVQKQVTDKYDLDMDLKYHLRSIVDQYKEFFPSDIKNDIKLLIAGRQKQVYKFMKSFRKGVLCQLCNYYGQQHIDEESYTVLFDEEICTTFLKFNFITLRDKYARLYKSILLFDEYRFLLSGRRLIEDNYHRKFLA